MTEESTVSLANLTDYICDENTGAHGNIYQRDLAFVLFVRGTMKEYKFKLATEMKAAGKFDDVIVYLEKLDETWLIQAKHAQLDRSNPKKISEKELFPFDERLQGKDFDLIKYMKSFFQVESEINGKKRYFIFTNKDLEDSGNLAKWVRDASGDVDAMINFSDFDGAYKSFMLDANNIDVFVRMVNKQFYDIKNAIVNVFRNGVVEKILMDFKTPVTKILSLKNIIREMDLDRSQATNSKEKEKKHKILRFSDDFLTKSEDPNSIGELFKVLREDFNKELSLVETQENAEIKKLLDNGKSRNQDIPAFINEEKVTAFFKSLTLCVNQPDELRSIVDKDIHMWLRTRVRPDCLGKFSESQLKLPATKFDEVFKSWHEPDMKGAAKSKNKPFLCSDAGTNCWDEIIKELDQFTKQLPEVLSRYYVNREVVFNENENANRQHSGISDNELSKQLTDSSIEDKCIALIAEPGMGKTTFMQYVSFKAQQLTSRTIFLIYLSSLKDKLQKSSECNDLGGALNIIGSALSVSNNSLLQKIFINSKDNEDTESKASDIWFFLDGFDEVLASDNPKLLSVVKQLLQTRRVQIVISGRKHVEKDLRDALTAKVMYLKPFRYIDQMTFLERYWNISRKDIDLPKFKRYAEQLLNRFHTNIYTFTKVPLMIRLLAEVYTDDLENFLQSEKENDRLEELSTEVFSVISLFEQFVRKSFSMKMFKKFDRNPYSKNVPYDDELDPLFERYIFEHELEALNMYKYNSKIQEALNCHATIYDKFRKRIEDGKEKSLLINLNKPHIQFVHQSFEEYFVARYLYENLLGCKDYLCSIIDNMELIRKFFFLLLNEDMETRKHEDLEQSSKQLSLLSTVCGLQNLAFWACEVLCLKVLKSLSSNHDLSTFFSEEYGSLLHVAAQNGSYEICQFLLKEVKINVNCLSCGKLDELTRMHQRNNSFEEQLSIKYEVTALHLAAAYEHKAVVELLLKNSAIVDARNSYLYTPLHVAAKKGHIDMMDLLIAHLANLNVQTQNGDTPLHFAIEFNHVDCAKLLIDHGADVNILNEDGLTPLVLAVRKGFPSIVAQLISKSANVDIQVDGYDQRKTLLHLAAEGGNLDTMKQIISSSVDIDAPDSSGATPLSYAASGGHVAIVEHLIELKANVNASETEKSSPLHRAILHGRTDVVKVLIAHSADVRFQDSIGKTPLHLAAQSILDIVKLLLDTPVDVNAVDEFKRTALHYAAKNNERLIMKQLIHYSADPCLADNVGWTPLHVAVHQECLDAVVLLVEQSIDINARDIEEQTPLHIAAKTDDRKIVEILIGKSADLNAQDKKNRTPLHVAINSGHTHNSDLLITRENINTQDHQSLTPLLLAAQKDEQAQYVKLLIDNGSDVNATRKDGWTVLHWAAEKGYFDIAELLVERSTDVNGRDASQRTPLHLAAANGHTTIVKLLISQSTDVTAADKDKNTPLHLAIEKGQTECVKLLIKAAEGSSLYLTNVVNAANQRKWTPLHLAAHHGNREITQLLIHTSSTVVDAQDKEGQTPLHMAAKNGHVDVAELLINKLANVNAQDKKQWTPLHLAARCGHQEIVELLRNHSADVNARDRSGKTPLDLATSSRRTEVVRLLSGLSGSERSSGVDELGVQQAN